MSTHIKAVSRNDRVLNAHTYCWFTKMSYPRHAVTLILSTQSPYPLTDIHEILHLSAPYYNALFNLGGGGREGEGHLLLGGGRREGEVTSSSPYPYPIYFFFLFDLCSIHIAKYGKYPKISKSKFLAKWHMQTVQTQISLIRVYTVCHLTKYFKKQLHKKQNLSQKNVQNKEFKILVQLPYIDMLT